jgi:tRNA threonylcarbamoyladenosine biosynthesis protein TsaB
LITLGIDTCEARGSVAVCKDGVAASLKAHESPEDFSSWLLPAVEKCLREAGESLRTVDVLAVATGPGSFTGLRVGITAVKAWAELYGKQVVGVSRLEVMARTVRPQAGLLAASFDAQRGQIFGGLYRVGADGSLSLVDQEMVIRAEEYVSWVGEKAGNASVKWVTLDPELIEGTPAWKERVDRGESLLLCGAALAAGIAQLGEERARKGEACGALHLDANYVRRSDAEIFWKDPATHGR